MFVIAVLTRAPRDILMMLKKVPTHTRSSRAIPTAPIPLKFQENDPSDQKSLLI